MLVIHNSNLKGIVVEKKVELAGRIPLIEKSVSFMAPHLPQGTSFQDLRDWIVANDHGRSGHYYALAATGWKHQVPFYTGNASACAERFKRYTHVVPNTDEIDRVCGMKLMHGFFCCGEPGNNSYSTIIDEDFKESRRLSDSAYGKICKKTAGVKYYFFRPKAGRIVNNNVWYGDLVVVSLSLRVNDRNKIVCLPLQVRTNLYFAGGHGAATYYDATYRKYTKRLGWDSKPWSDDDFRISPDPIAEQMFHVEILEGLLQAIC